MTNISEALLLDSEKILGGEKMSNGKEKEGRKKKSRRLGWGSIPTWIIAVIAVLGGFKVFVELPSVEQLQEIVSSAIVENSEWVATLIMAYSQDPVSARNTALDQALDKAEQSEYIAKTTDGYVVRDKWFDNNRLITDIEKQRIFSVIAENGGKELNEVLVLAVSQLVRKNELTLQIVTADYGDIRLSPYEKIGIIGGYVPSLKMEMPPTLRGY